MSRAYDRVVPSRLLHNLRKIHFPQWIVDYISSFLSDCSTSLCLPGFSSAMFSTFSGIPQGSPFSPILFLFYNANLVDICNSLDSPITSIGFVDDVNILAFGKSTEETCRMLRDIHDRWLIWGKMHGTSFVPEKYALVHFSRKERNIPITPLILPTTILNPSPHAHVLGLILDSRLSWHPHIASIKSKLRTQTFALTRLTSSTWGAPLNSCRLLYTPIVRPAITYASNVWYSPLGMPYARKYVMKDLMPLQNNCLRAISGAYRATPISNLEVEDGVPPLGIHLDSLQARFKMKLEESEVAGVIREAVGKVERCLGMEQGGNVRIRRRRRQGARGGNPGDTRGETAASGNRHERERGGTAEENGEGVVEDGVEMASRGLPQGAATTPHQSQLSWARQWLPEDDPRRSLSLKSRAKYKAQQSWHSMGQASAPSPAPSTSVKAPPGTDVLALHQLLLMPETVLAVQLQTGKNGFNAFL
jgi:hypothetical protein